MPRRCCRTASPNGTGPPRPRPSAPAVGDNRWVIENTNAYATIDTSYGSTRRLMAQNCSSFAHCFSRLSSFYSSSLSLTPTVTRSRFIAFVTKPSFSYSRARITSQSSPRSSALHTADHAAGYTPFSSASVADCSSERQATNHHPETTHLPPVLLRVQHRALRRQHHLAELEATTRVAEAQLDLLLR